MQCTKSICNKKSKKKATLYRYMHRKVVHFIFFSIFTLVLMCVIAQNKNLKCQIVHVDDYYQQNPPSSNHDNLFFKYPTLIDRMRLGTGTIDFISSHLERCKSVHKDI